MAQPPVYAGIRSVSEDVPFKYPSTFIFLHVGFDMHLSDKVPRRRKMLESNS